MRPAPRVQFHQRGRIGNQPFRHPVLIKTPLGEKGDDSQANPPPPRGLPVWVGGSIFGQAGGFPAPPPRFGVADSSEIGAIMDKHSYGGDPRGPPFPGGGGNTPSEPPEPPAWVTTDRGAG